MHIQKVSKQRITARGLLFFLGCAILLLALLLPMDAFGMNFMFSVHMVQHLLLSLAVPPLFLLSVPSRRLHEFLVHHPRIERGLRLVTKAFVASVLFNATLWFWHAPPLFQAMMSSEVLHELVNLLYLLTGCLFWWPLLNPGKDEEHVLSLGGKLAYLFFSDMPMMLLGAGMTFSPPLYSFSMTNPTMFIRVTAQDQQLGGLLMWIVGSIFFIILASIFFLRWMLQQERVQQAQEAEWDEEQESSSLMSE